MIEVGSTGAAFVTESGARPRGGVPARRAESAFGRTLLIRALGGASGAAVVDTGAAVVGVGDAVESGPMATTLSDARGTVLSTAGSTGTLIARLSRLTSGNSMF